MFKKCNTYGFKKGIPGFWLGKKRPEIGLKISIANQGRIVSKETRLKMSIAQKKRIRRKLTLEERLVMSVREKNKHRHHSIETCRKQSIAHLREKAPNWKGGITALRKKIRNTFEYKLWREAVYQRDKFTCQKCGTIGSVLHAHHKEISFSELLDKYSILSLEQALACKELWDVSIGETLCKSCHKLLHPCLCH